MERLCNVENSKAVAKSDHNYEVTVISALEVISIIFFQLNRGSLRKDYSWRSLPNIDNPN